MTLEPLLDLYEILEYAQANPFTATVCLWLAWRITRRIFGSDRENTATNKLKDFRRLTLEHLEGVWFVYVDNEFQAQDRDLDRVLRSALTQGPAAEYRIQPSEQNLTPEQLSQVLEAMHKLARDAS
jgi:hypothetical protein